MPGSRRDRNAAIGAVLGASSQASKTRPGRLYTVTTNEDTMVQIAMRERIERFETYNCFATTRS